MLPQRGGHKGLGAKIQQKILRHRTGGLLSLEAWTQHLETQAARVCESS